MLPTWHALLESLLNKPPVLHVTIIRDTLILRFFASFAKSQNLILAKFLCYTVSSWISLEKYVHTALVALNKAILIFWLNHSCLLHYRLNSNSYFRWTAPKHPTTPTYNMLKSHKNHRDNQPLFLLTAGCEHPPPTSYHPF